jgi:NTP pyrophosphatase (non-canonical NTP hydrolase)
MKAYENKGITESLNYLAQDINKWALQKGFWNLPLALLQLCDENSDVHREVEKLVKARKNALITSEVAEHLEGMRKDAPSDLEGFSSEEEELADVIIRCLDYAGQYKLRIGEAVAAKMAKNEGRPYLHGKAY